MDSPHGPACGRITAGHAVLSRANGGAMADYDSPWKEALELYFPAFLALFFHGLS